MSNACCSCRKAGFRPALAATRGYDHGTFVPLKLAFPDAAIPVVQLSLLASLDAKVLPWHSSPTEHRHACTEPAGPLAPDTNLVPVCKSWTEDSTHATQST